MTMGGNCDVVGIVNEHTTVIPSLVKVTVLSTHEGILDISSHKKAGKVHISKSLKKLFEDPYAVEYLLINTYQGNVFLGKEQLERLMDALMLVTTIRMLASSVSSIKKLTEVRTTAGFILKTANQADYQVEKMLGLLVK